jgi:replicative DNA helicase
MEDKVINKIEQEILGMCFHKPDNIEKVAGFGVLPNDFFVEGNREIFENCIELKESNIAINPDTLRSKDKNYLLHLLKIENMSTLKELCHTLKTIGHNIRLEQSCKDFIEGRDILNTKSIELFQEALDIPSFELKTEIKDGDYLAEATKKEMEAFLKGRVGLKVGIRKIDEFKKGFLGGSLNIIGARPGIGKTAFALNLMSNIDRKASCVYFALEMSDVEVNQRIASMRSGEAYENILYPTIKNAIDMLNIVDNNKLKNSSTIDKARVNINYLKTVCKNLKKQGRCDCIFIDQLSKIDTAGLGHKKTETYPKITNELKWLARELDVPIFLLCQINREGKHKPTREDLKDSGAIEEDADCIILLHRNYEEQVEEVEERNDAPIVSTAKQKKQGEIKLNDTEMQIIFAKNRNGRVGSKIISCLLEKQWIGDIK